MKVKRDRPEDQLGVPQVKVTPEMLEAGARVIEDRFCFSSSPPSAEVAEEVARAVFLAMMAHSCLRMGAGRLTDACKS